MTARLRSWFTLTLLCCAAACAQDNSPFTKTEAMIPVRDGVKLHTVIFAPRDARERLPILLERTPYGAMADEKDLRARSAHLIADGYIFAFQDIRGRFTSEGQFVMQRQVRDKRDPKAIDESTDTYDTIQWLLDNVKGHNGRAGILGISYGGWLTTMALLDPHPALKAVSEQASPADMFLGDDFHHNGAFRLSYGFEYAALHAQLWVRVCRAAGNIQRDQHQLRVRPRRHLSVVSHSGRAAECRSEQLSWQDTHLERLRQPPELRPVLAEAGVRAVHWCRHWSSEGPESERGRLVGPGRFLRSGEDLRAVRKERPRSSELPGGRPLESWRLGAPRRQQTWRDFFRQQHQQILPHAHRSALVRLLAERQGHARLPRSHGLSDRVESLGEVRRVAAAGCPEPQSVFAREWRAVFRFARGRRRGVRQLHLRSGAPSALPASADQPDLSGRRLACVAGGGSAVRGQPPRRADMGDRAIEGRSEDRR